jgi:CelD/BcsL family acetyltransferase involved in cellulose biosynthesis
VLSATGPRPNRIAPPEGAAEAFRALRPITRVEELATFAPWWAALRSPLDSPTLDLDWLRAWAETYGAEYRLRLVAVAAADRIAAVAPLVRRRGRPGSLELPGERELGEPMDFLAADAQAAAALGEALGRARLPLFLRRVPADGVATASLGRWRRGRLMIVRPIAGLPSLALDDRWRDPVERFNPGRRSDLRRAMRHARAIGPVRCATVTPAPGDLGPLLEEAFAVEGASWKARAGTELGPGTRLGAFFRRYAGAASRDGALRLCFLRIGGRTAAMQIAVERGSRLWLLKIAYDEAFARCSPGTLLMLHTLAYAAERGLRSCEFLGSAEPWTAMWTEAARPCAAVAAYPLTPRGGLALVTDTVRLAPALLARWRRRRARP